MFPDFTRAQQPDFLFAKRAGGPDNEQANDLAVDSADNIALVGHFVGTVDFDGTVFTSVSSRDIFVAKYSSIGQLSWLRHAGGTGTGGVNSAIGVTVDGEHNIIATGQYIGSVTFGGTTLPSGGSSEELFLVKYDSNGNLLWAKAATGSFTVAGFNMATDNANNIYVTGLFGHHNFGGNVSFGTTTLTSVGGGDIFIAKYDAAGNVVWAKRAGSSVTNNTDVGQDITTDSLGNSVVVGYFQGNADFDSIVLNSAGDRDIFIAKYDSSGNVLWAKRIGASGDDRGMGIRMGDGGDIVITGKFSGSVAFGNTNLSSVGASDIFIASYDLNGNPIWAKRAGGSASDIFADTGAEVAFDGSGNSVITGHFSGTADFGGTFLTSSGSEDVFVTKCDVGGNFLWAKRGGGMESGGDTDRGTAIVVDGLNNIFVAGLFSGAADFDSNNVNSAGGNDIFLAKLGPSNHALVALCSNIVLSLDTSGQATLSPSHVDGGSFDPDGDPITFSIDKTSFSCADIGDNNVTLTVTDDKGEFDQCTAIVTVVDDTPPVITTITDPVKLWPPNHKYTTIPVSELIESVSDNCPTLSVSEVFITQVTSDEEEDAKGGGDGKTLNDIVIDPSCQTVQLRAEREGGGNGRVYTIHLSVDDGNGNSITAIYQVIVPKSQNGRPALDDGQVYTVVGNCNNLSKSGEPTEDITVDEYLPDGFELFQNHPNPFNPNTTIAFVIPETRAVSLEIYNLRGQLVQTLVSGTVTVGQHSVFWDGTDLRGANVASGIYVYKLQAQDFVLSRKMVLTK
jgi:hypothetical protein